ncbi:hypothetical protein DSLASN_08560 [Desulfoluna limicola]|uniref:Uncharacterized protein n=1 Tax=Desulfoluna limicola TaxID=2810562 RepID=A0ABN6EXZ7_9BACT|nr:hypothetical protein DSLASN_08560 [Desulfoluna limicola]
MITATEQAGTHGTKGTGPGKPEPPAQHEKRFKQRNYAHGEQAIQRQKTLRAKALFPGAGSPTSSLSQKLEILQTEANHDL